MDEVTSYGCALYIIIILLVIILICLYSCGIFPPKLTNNYRNESPISVEVIDQNTDEVIYSCVGCVEVKITNSLQDTSIQCVTITRSNTNEIVFECEGFLEVKTTNIIGKVESTSTAVY